MKVSFGGYYLAGDPALGMRINPPAMLISKSADRLTQTVDGPGWSTIDIIDRGNQVTTISFRCERVFDTTQEAESYMLGYEAANHHPWDRGTFFAILPTSGGDKYHYMHPATISPPRFSYMGCRIFAEYTVQGGQLMPVLAWAARLWFAPDGDRAPTGEKAPEAGQGWVRVFDDIGPAASITADDYWVHVAGDLAPQ